MKRLNGSGELNRFIDANHALPDHARDHQQFLTTHCLGGVNRRSGLLSLGCDEAPESPLSRFLATWLLAFSAKQPLCQLRLCVLRLRWRFGKEALDKARALLLITLSACLQKGLTNLRDASPLSSCNSFQFFLKVRSNA
jgi:hypothetical protein